jgi:hypothetical protein
MGVLQGSKFSAASDLQAALSSQINTVITNGDFAQALQQYADENGAIALTKAVVDVSSIRQVSATVDVDAPTSCPSSSVPSSYPTPKPNLSAKPTRPGDTIKPTRAPLSVSPSSQPTAQPAPPTPQPTIVVYLWISMIEQHPEYVVLGAMGVVAGFILLFGVRLYRRFKRWRRRVNWAKKKLRNLEKGKKKKETLDVDYKIKVKPQFKSRKKGSKYLKKYGVNTAVDDDDQNDSYNSESSHPSSDNSEGEQSSIDELEQKVNLNVHIKGDFADIESTEERKEEPNYSNNISASLSKTTVAVENKANNEKAFIYIKPHANNAAVRMLVSRILLSKGIKVVQQGKIASQEIEKESLLDRQYASMAKKALVLSPSSLFISSSNTQKFYEKFALHWHDALKEQRVVNLNEACDLLDINYRMLGSMWKRSIDTDKVSLHSDIL